MILAIILLIIGITSLILCFHSIYYAFFKKKDERSKWIVTRSMAQAFTILFGLNGLQTIFKFINYETWSIWWTNFKGGIYIEPSGLMLIILGIMILINKKKYGE